MKAEDKERMLDELEAICCAVEITKFNPDQKARVKACAAQLNHVFTETYKNTFVEMPEEIK